ncbi:thioredoxin-like protein, putative [Phytophthora infestans T30-4]|uniref:Thioredoxin-like protein, putative n=2 Tax=Phytophthora infestans TaxID=4787 RepID=D0NLE7_PHYIT|nr:thioredoxin-like protein, putative [Phytophthora infestans T30-4]KAF4031397.1 PITH domain-containing protein [Phytophthora infestans]EEY60465.1 thioredoxin-like protein, putative [Phytophthora infestans T30-4]KAF4039776.1 PITH domain-containing protein [Phytophthora infestans]KAF4129752.1 PITH domain-containing protein [Phytophthora infestans]KAF4132995.1 PITH domain-containing protein [Phytophthora infestans]|eukprot:XP_002900261.1 thioredoxin-like protein, putative [Phytophthora infestans T30-4]
MSSTTAAAKTRAYGDLKESISTKDCYCLNEDPNKPFRNLFAGDDSLVLKSDADEQLMLYLEFQDAVKIFSLNIVAPQGEEAPRVIKLYVNRPNLGFSDAGDVEPTQTIELKEEDLLPENDVELRFVKFQRVKSVSVFVEENYGAEETVLSSLKFFGEPLAGTNMNELKKISDE